MLAGRVVSAEGRPVARVRVSAVPDTEPIDIDSAAAASVSTHQQPPPAATTAITDARGEFVFLHLPSGRVRLSAEAAGTRLTANVDVEEGTPGYAVLQAVTANIKTPGGSRGDVPPLATAELLDPLDPDIDGVLPSEYQSAAVARSSPGDRADSPEEDEEHRTAIQPGSMIDGGTYRASLDVLSAGQNSRSGARGNAAGGSASRALFARGSYRNLRLSPRTFSAQTGIEIGGLSADFRAGVRGLHGGGFVTVRASALDAANPYSIVTHYRDGVITGGVVKPQDTDVQAGGRIGFTPLERWAGAGVWRERVFAFASLEGRLRNAPIDSTPATATFYTLNATQRALLGTRGVTGTQTNAALNFLDGLSGSIARSETRLLSFGRLDGNPGEHDAVAVTFTGNHLRSPAGAAFDQLSDAVVARGRSSVGDSALDVNAAAAHWTHALSPRIENQARVQWVHDEEGERPRAPLAQEPAISPNGESPEVEIAPEGFTFGTAANLDRTAYPDERRLELADTLRWAPELLGRRHIFAFGGAWTRTGDRVDSLKNANGTFLYDSADVNGRAGGLVDWITDATFNVHASPNGGCPSITAAAHLFCFRTYTQAFGSAAQQFTTHDFAAFAEDTFFPQPSLRITFGARYEYTLLPLPQSPNAGLDTSLRAAAIPAQLAGATAAFPEDRNNIGPRVSAAWSPQGGRWFTARAGYGWFFGHVPGTTVRAALADNGLLTGIEQVRITPATEIACPQVANQGFGYPCAFGSAPPTAVAQTASAMVFAGSFRLPAVQRASLTLERAFGSRLILELGYAGAWATQLPSSTDVNIAPSTSSIRFALQGGGSTPGLVAGRAFSVPLYTARRLPGFGPVTAITSQANATYHAGSLQARLRSWHRLDARASVVFSRAIDDNPQSGTSSGPRVNGAFDPFALGYDKGLSDLHSALRFTGSLVVRSELRHGPAWTRLALNGWRAAASATAASGAPYSYEIFGGTRLPGGHTSVNGSGGATFLPTVGRNTLRLPARANVDLRLERDLVGRGVTFRGVKASAFAETFNLLNQRNLSRVETRAFLLGTPANGVTPLLFQDAAAVAAEAGSIPAFGTATSSTSGTSRERLIALGIRLAF